MTPGQIARSLANPNSPIVIRALEKTCPECKVDPGYWCIGVAEGHATEGKARKRIHFARCEVKVDPDVKAATR